MIEERREACSKISQKYKSIALFNVLYLRRAVSLPGDREEDRERERSIGDQLNNIFSHIEVE